MSYRLLFFAVFLCLSGNACTLIRPFGSAHVQAKITEEGLLTCFAPETSLDGKPVWCEASAVAYDGRNLLFANDKDMPPNLSPVFSIPPAALPDSAQPLTYLMPAAYAAGRKYEDFAQTPDGKFVFLTTAFDRVKLNSPEWDAYNTLLYWRRGDEQHPHVLTPSGQHTTSVGFRQKLARVLATDDLPGAVPYFKIEGLAATEKQLLFGIREVGQAFDKFRYVNKIIAVSYVIGKQNGEDRIQLFDDWRLVADFDPATVRPALPAPLGLSSLEYDPVRRCIWMLTSYEKDGKVDAYLWANTLAELKAGKPFRVVRSRGRKPLRFGHKAEDLTLLDKNRLLIIHDDDRLQLPVGAKIRQPNQAPYAIITVK